MSRGSPDTPPHTLGRELPVSWHAIFPGYPFEAESAIRSRDISSHLCPLRGRYNAAPRGAAEPQRDHGGVDAGVQTGNQRCSNRANALPGNRTVLRHSSLFVIVGADEL